MRPNAAVLRTIQDRQVQKQFLDRLGIAQAAWAPTCTTDAGGSSRDALARFGGQGIVQAPARRATTAKASSASIAATTDVRPGLAFAVRRR